MTPLIKSLFLKTFESKEDVPKVSEEIIENKSRDEECEREKSKIGDAKQEEKGSTEITLNDDFGLIDVGDVHDTKDVNGLEAILTMSRDHEIPTFEPLAPSPNLPEPLELYVPTLEPNIIPMADQLEGKGQSLHGMASLAHLCMIILHSLHSMTHFTLMCFNAISLNSSKRSPLYILTFA
ncbi:hypothetical protein Acr_00g0096250 [Actinidia rufa]|uniref:Uncharacterized protein n=1 Tax=Actinidia rufa TaxID=165716 RepID=A0A7J0DYX6_9ERIC|nr:hypothetical protein Acr_00g0096250 [Actinidia rufa]